MYLFQQRTKNLNTTLKRWNKTVFGNISKSKTELEAQMENVQ